MVRVQLLSGGEGCEVRGNLETADSRWRVGEYFFGGDDDGGLLSATEMEGGGGGRHRCHCLTHGAEER